MPENNEKYGKLNDFMTKLTKPELLFGDGGLFGGLKGNHNILILFARYVHDLKVQNNHVPNTINSEDFIRYLNSGKFPEVKNTEEIVGRIKALKGNIIKDGPSLQENTLYKCAVILDDLGIGQSADKIAGQFVSALENVNKLRARLPVAKVEPKTRAAEKGRGEGQKAAAGTAVDSQGKPVAGESATSTDTSASVSVNSETPAQDKDISLKIDSEKKTDTKVPESITAQTTPELEKDKTPQPAIEPKPKLEPTIDKAEPKIEPNAEPTVDKVEPGAEPSSGPVAEQAAEPTPDVHAPTFRPLTKPSQREAGDSEIERERTEQDKFETGQQPANATPAQAPASATVPRGTGKGKRVRPVGDRSSGLRGLIKNTERLQEPPVQSSEEKKEKGEKGKNEKPEGEGETGQNPAEAEQDNQSRIADRGGTTTQQRSGGSHLGKKLAKLAGAGVAGGTILPLFGGSSEAAVLSGNLPHTIGKIINFITHLFS